MQKGKIAKNLVFNQTRGEQKLFVFWFVFLKLVFQQWMDEMLIAQIKVQSMKAERLEAERPLQCLVSSFHPIYLIISYYWYVRLFA